MLALGLLLAGCGKDPMQNLTPGEAVAYTVLAEYLQNITEPDQPLIHLNLCVEVALPDGGKVRDMAGLLQLLQANLPPGLSATLVPLKDCRKFSDIGPYRLPDGTPAKIFFASGNYEGDDIIPDLLHGEQVWEVGVICGKLCGIGSRYRVRFEDGRPIAIHSRDWLS